VSETSSARQTDRVCLHRLLEQPGSYPRIEAAWVTRALCRELPVRLFAHIGDVYRRLEVAAHDAGSDLAGLRLAVLLHEEAADRVPSLIEGAGLTDLAPVVTAVVEGFGELWKAGGDAPLADYVAAHRPALAPLLLFELAHEGRPTPSMERAAALGGLTGAFRGWVTRLADEEHPTPTR
jgi:hypothetical protein